MSKPEFVHLHVHTAYSLLDGAIRVKDLLAQVQAYGMPAVAITDHGNLYGAVEFYQAAEKAGIRPIVGCEAYMAPNSLHERNASTAKEAASHLTLLAFNAEGYRNLVKLVTAAHLEGFYYKPRIDKELLSNHAGGLIALSGCLKGEINGRLLAGDPAGAQRLASEYRDILGRENFFIELHDHGLEAERRCLPGLVRIARELHDGVAQFLGYVNTKIIAISTLLEKKENQAAQKHIDQIMQAVHDQSVDVRASIVGLKLAERSGGDLAVSLREYVHQCNLLLDLPIELVIEPQAEKIQLNPEVELHLMRIVQEAISNIRKHASANFAQIRLAIAGDVLVLSIQDDGVGFNPWQLNIDHPPHFGLQTMHERAELAGAELSLVSEPGVGTTVTLRLRLEKT